MSRLAPCGCAVTRSDHYGVLKCPRLPGSSAVHDCTRSASAALEKSLNMGGADTMELGNA
eukprot:7137896-Alexandrium_andersonii.AAC.1